MSERKPVPKRSDEATVIVRDASETEKASTLYDPSKESRLTVRVPSYAFKTHVSHGVV